MKNNKLYETIFNTLNQYIKEDNNTETIQQIDNQNKVDIQSLKYPCGHYRNAVLNTLYFDPNNPTNQKLPSGHVTIYFPKDVLVPIFHILIPSSEHVTSRYFDRYNNKTHENHNNLFMEYFYLSVFKSISEIQNEIKERDSMKFPDFGIYVYKQAQLKFQYPLYIDYNSCDNIPNEILDLYNKKLMKNDKKYEKLQFYNKAIGNNGVEKFQTTAYTIRTILEPDMQIKSQYNDRLFTPIQIYEQKKINFMSQLVMEYISNKDKYQQYIKEYKNLKYNMYNVKVLNSLECTIYENKHKNQIEYIDIDHFNIDNLKIIDIQI